MTGQTKTMLKTICGTITFLLFLLTIPSCQAFCQDRIERNIAALKDGDVEVRMNAVQALGEIKDPRAVEPLIAALKDMYKYVRGNAARALGEISDQRAVEPLIVALKDENEYVRRQAAWALGEIKEPRTVEPLIAALKDKNWDVRENVAKVLGNIKDPRAIEPLIAALKDWDGFRRGNAAEALEKIGDKRAINPLLEALTDWHSNTSVAKALLGLGGKPESEEDKIHLLVAQRDGKRLSENWEVTQKVLLKDVESNDSCTIENALYAFIGLGKKEIIPLLINKLNRKGTATMAEAYFNCGSGELANVARVWASKHGYYILAGSGANRVNGNSKR